MADASSIAGYIKVYLEESFYYSNNIYYNSGNVGIGTATIQSSYKLQVQGNAWVENQLVFNNSYRGGGGDFPCNKILLYGGGNVPTNTSAGEVFGFGVAANGKLEYFASNTHAFYTGTTGGTNYGTERMVITSTGNVGIGITNPSYKIHLCNTGIVANETGGATCMPLRISAGNYSDTGNGTATLIGLATQETAGTVWTKCAIGHCRTAQFDVGSIVFLCNNSATSSSVSMSDERMRITSTGNVGIGTNAPTCKLQIDNSTTDFAGILFVRNPTNSASQNSQVTCAIAGTSANKAVYTLDVSGSHGWSMYTSGNNTNFNINSTYNCNSLYDRMVITSTGNVGIGTNNPFCKLDINQGTSGTTGATCFPLCISAGAYTENGNGTATLIGLSTYRDNIGGSAWYKCAMGHCRTDSYDRGSIVFLCNNVANGLSATMSDERMRITSTGNVLINKPNSAGVRLEVITTYDDVNSSLRIDAAGGNDLYSLNIWAFVQGAGMVGWRFRIKSVIGGDNTAIQISNTGSVYFPIGSSSASDSRIKKDIEDINDESALNKLLLIQPTTYNYIDVERNKGFGKVYGFIAQQIREVIPEAITIIVKEIIPNIYKSCLINNKRDVYHSIPLDTPIDTSVKIDDALYKIKEIYEDYFVIDNDIDFDEAFVFGYSVDDFHTLDKTYIFTLNVCATQELHRRIEAQSVLLKSQDDRIKDLETKVATLISSM